MVNVLGDACWRARAVLQQQTAPLFRSSFTIIFLFTQRMISGETEPASAPPGIHLPRRRPAN
eukprot:1239101-Pyramimonas_sp.AAC.1